MKPSAILIGLAAGIASALLFAGLVLQSPMAVVLSLAAPVPIFIASLGWGSRMGFLAAATASLAIAAFTGSFGSGLILLASMALPSAIVGHLAGLARPSDAASRAGTFPPPIAGPLGPQLDWYPLERILFAVAALASLGCIFIGWLVGYDPAELGPEIAAALTLQMGAAVDPATQQQVQALTAVMIRIVPFVQPALLVVVLVADLHLSAAVTRLSGRLPRPKDDIPAETGLPKIALPIFAVAVAGSFVPGVVGLLAAVVAGTFGAAFTLVGLASLHRRTRGTGHRGLLLFSVYAAIVFLSFPLVAATALGLFETIRKLPRPAAPD